MGINKTILILGVVAIGIYALYLGRIEIVTGCLGIAGGILTPTHTNQKEQQP